MPPRNNIACMRRAAGLMPAFALGFAASALAQAPAVPPTPLIPASSPAAPATPKPADAAKQEEADEKLPLPVSLFFTPEELAKINAALAEHERLKNIKETKADDKANDYLNQLTGGGKDKPKEPEAEPQTYVYPQFYLESLVYHSADDWVVLINHQRISSKGAPEGLDIGVLSVDKEKVLLEWRPKNMDRVNESWIKGHSEDILFDTRNGKLVFTLLPNQTFSSFAMQVVEGKTRPVMLDMRTVPAVPPQAPAADQKPEQAAADEIHENITSEDIRNDVGLKGLKKTYKRLGLE